MTLLPCEQQRIGNPRPDLDEYELDVVCANPFCTNLYGGLERHHIVRKSFAGRGQDAWWVEIDWVPRPNCVFVCRDCHRRLTENEAEIVFMTDAYIWRENGQTDFLACKLPSETEGEKIASSVPESHSAIGATADGGEPKPSRALRSPSVSPGTKCPTCARKVPYPKQEKSPETRVISFRVPVDEYETTKELLEAVALHVGVDGQRFGTFKTVSIAVATALQDESLRGFWK